MTALAADRWAEQANASALALGAVLRSRSGRAGGCVVAVATPDAAPDTLTLRALTAAHLAAVPVRQQRALLATVADLRPDLVVLDVAICATGVQPVLSDLKSEGAPAVILVGALANATVRAALLCAGADDCLPFPYPLDELVARVLAVLRRAQPQDQRGQGPGCLVAGALRVDLDRRAVQIDGRPVALTLVEFRLLAYLLRHRGLALSRQRLLVDVWGHTVGTTDTVTVHIRRLRSKIEADPLRPRWIETVWGVGYRFNSGPGVPPGLEVS